MSDSNKQALIEKYRDINVEHDWWEYTIDDFKERMQIFYGIAAYDVSFSGFWSQGDGASFEGHVSNVPSFLQAHDLMESYPMLIKLLEEDGAVHISVVRRGLYQHENTMYIDVCQSDQFCNLNKYGHLFRPYREEDSDCDVRVKAVEFMDKKLDAEIQDLEEVALEIFREHARGLYRLLNDEYDYLTSDEAVWDSVVTNELDRFDEEVA